jgi:DNA polymerase III delta prime subunit
MCEELGLDYIEINGSMNGGIDTLRTEIKNFASTISFTGTRKMVILDEADYLNAQSTQPALRNFMEEFSKNCGFILTCNFKNRIIEPLHSRCSVIEFKIPSSQKPKLAAQFHKRACGILEQEGVEFDKAVVAEVVTKHFPDWRRVLNELQRYSATGKIDSGILANLGEENFKGLVDLLKNKRFNDMRKWVSENLDTEPTAFFRKFYDMASTYMKPNSIPQLVLLLGRYQYQSAFVADQEINTVAFLTEVMVEAEWV